MNKKAGEDCARRIALWSVAIAMVLMAWPLSAHVHSTKYLSVRSLELQVKQGSSYKKTSSLQRGGKYRFHVELINSAPGGPNTCVLGCQEWAYREVRIQITADQQCYQFKKTGKANYVFTKEFPGKLERFERTRQVWKFDAEFTWMCTTRSVSSLPSRERPRFILSGHESAPIPKEKSAPLLPQSKLAAVGGSCKSNGDCQSGGCDGGKCIPKPGGGKDGDYCTRQEHCNRYDMCYKKKCQARFAIGKSCPSGNWMCNSGYCDAGSGSGNTRKCVPARGRGEGGKYCSMHAHCKSNKCTNKKCSTQKGLGKSCKKKGNAACASGYCDAGWGSGNTNKCVPAAGRGKKGQYCSMHSHCKSNKCSKKKCK